VGARSFSPTALENFASCPYRSLQRSTAGRRGSEALETIDPLTKGALFHDVQFES